jgi:hypothetical protein
VIRAGAILVAFLLAACGGTASPADSQVKAEESLLFGIRRDAAVDCQPERDGLPEGALGAVTCLPQNGLVTRFTLVDWDTQDHLLSAYFSALDAQGVQRASGDCMKQESGEDAYVPGDDDEALGIPGRQGCFLVGNEAVVLVTLPPSVLAEVHGNADQLADLAGWVWIGNQDVPGGPTIWNKDGPINVEKG